MSLAYSDTTNKNGIIQRVEQELGFIDGHISGDNTRMAFWAGSINLALDKVFHKIFGADGKWQFDDGNHTDYPIITTNLVSAQRDYSFTTDENSNVILTIDRVFIRYGTTEPYYELFPVDAQRDREEIITDIVDGQAKQGRAQYYDKTATGIFLNSIPDANVTSGLKLYISREASYFATAVTFDTTKKPGFMGLYHEYLVLEPAYRYARANRLGVQETLKRDVLEMEEAIQDAYARRDKHDIPTMNPAPIIYQ